jgi:two-component system sensor histidine kinase KdpD
MREYAGAALVMTACTILGTVVVDFLSITDVAVLYLLGVAVVASWAPRPQAIFAAVLSVALFDFFFVPPRFTFAVSDLHYIFTFVVMLATALVVSRLAVRVRTEVHAAETRERGTATLLPMTGDLLDAKTLGDVTDVLSRHARDAFDAEVHVMVRKTGKSLEPALAEQAYQTWEAARTGDTAYLPLVGSHGRLGILQVKTREPQRFADPAVLWLLQTFAAQAAVALERVSTVA